MCYGKPDQHYIATKILRDISGRGSLFELLGRLGIDIRPRTLRATLHRMRLSFRTLREVPHKSADAETRKKFIQDTQKKMNALARAGYANFYEDEETVLLAAQTGRSWQSIARVPRCKR